MMMLFIKSYLCKTEEVMDNKSNCQGPPLFSGLGSGSIEVSKYVREKTRTCAACRVRARVRALTTAPVALLRARSICSALWFTCLFGCLHQRRAKTDRVPGEGLKSLT